MGPATGRLFCIHPVSGPLRCTGWCTGQRQKKFQHPPYQVATHSEKIDRASKSLVVCLPAEGHSNRVHCLADQAPAHGSRCSHKRQGERRLARTLVYASRPERVAPTRHSGSAHSASHVAGFTAHQPYTLPVHVGCHSAVTGRACTCDPWGA